MSGALGVVESSKMMDMTYRERAHLLIDQLPEDRLPGVVATLERGDFEPRRIRKIRTAGIFDGDPDLSETIKAQVRREWRERR